MTNPGPIIIADKNLVNAVYLSMPAGGVNTSIIRIPFQFPPVIKSDNKGGSWEEKEGMAEPFVIYKGGKAREISMKWTYIVTNQPGADSAVWDIAKIAKYVKNLRGYFYNKAGQYLVVKFKAYDQVGSSSNNKSFWTFRAESVNIEHSDAMIIDNGLTYPLRTDISMRLKFFITLADKSKMNPEGNTSLDQPVINIKGLEPVPSTIDWF